MPLFNRLRQYFFHSRKKELEPATAYDQWSSGYDNQPGNLMLDLDEVLFGELLSQTVIEGKMVADIGCGTGRHWGKIFARKPIRLTGFDVSAGMLAKLKEKYPQAETHLLTDQQLPDLADASIDVLVSTLTIAHIGPVGDALKEWRRVLKPGGDLLITDYHPEALAKGGQRTFRHNEETIAVRNYIHKLPKLLDMAKQLDLQLLRCIEKKIDQSAKPYYEKQQALRVYNRFYGVNIIYGLHLKAAGQSPSLTK